MDKRFIKLFQEIAHTTSVLAERVQKYDYKNKTEESDKAAAIMHDEYNDIYNRMSDENFDSTTLTRADYIKLLIATNIVIGNLENQEKEIASAIDGYKTKVVPILAAITEKSQDDATAVGIAEQLLTISEEEEENQLKDKTE